MTGVLLRPAFPNDTYYGGWAHRFGHLEWYGGRVLHVSLDGLEFLPAEHSDSRRVREQLLSGAALHVRARAGPRPPGLAPLFTIHDGHQREILLLGIDGHDIVYRYRTRAIATGFRGPEVRVRDAIRGIAWRDSLEVTVRPVHTGYCIRVNTTEHCGLGFTVGTGWAFLFDDGPSSRWPKTVLDSSWLAVLFFPVGLWARFPWSLPAVVAFSLAFLLIVPTAIGLIPTSTTELLAALIGLLAGFATTVYHFAHDA